MTQNFSIQINEAEQNSRMKKEDINKNLKAIVVVFFVITGATGLIYQITWFKYLSLFLGNTTYAQMIVLSAFLGGLAIGNYIFGKKSDAIKNPLKFYALFELSIGLYCLAYPTLSFLFGDAFISIASAFNTSGQNVIFNTARLLLSSLLLFIPTIAMGGTLPVLSKFYIENVESTRKDLGILYFLNSFGAVWGIIFAGFQLIELVGLNGTIYSAAVINVAIGLTALFLSKYSSTAKEEINGNLKAEDEPKKSSPVALKIIVLVAGLSGMAALVYEMVWTRLFINIFGSSTYAFSIMLLVFISGITLGGFLISQKVFAKFDKYKFVTLLQVLIAGSTMLVLTLYERLPYFLWKASSYFIKTEETFPIFLTLEFLICFLILFIPTIMMGMTLPLIASIVAESNRKIGLAVGNVFAVNTLGTVVGVILTALLFIPFFGIKGSFEIGITINIIAAVLIILTYFGFEKIKRWSYSAAAIGVLCIYLIVVPQWNINASLYGVFKTLHKEPPASFDAYLQSRGDFDILYYKEGMDANVAVTESGYPVKQKRLIINGKPDASSITDMPTQILLGQIPMLLHNDAKNVFVVGFGSGVTIGSVLLHNVDKVTCAEISDEVIEAGKFFAEENHNCMDDERLTIYNEDALTLLKLSDADYDVIISEPSNPWIAGIGNLFSQEYFELCQSKLNQNGIMVQWFHLYESQDDVVKLVLSTFSNVFPNCQVWSGVANDIIIVGYKNDYPNDFRKIESKFENTPVKNELEKIGIENPFTFLTCQSLSDRGVFILSDKYPINSELHPLLEFWAPKSFYIGKTSGLIYQYDEKFDTLDNRLMVSDYYKLNKPSAENIKNAALYHLNTTRNYRFAYGLTEDLIAKGIDDYQTQMLNANLLSELQIDNPLKYHYKEIIAQYPDSTSLLHDYLNLEILGKVNSTNFMKIKSLKKLSDKYITTSNRDTASTAKLYIQIARNYLLNSEVTYAKDLCERAAQLIKAKPEIVYHLPMDEYFYTFAMAGHYLDLPEITFENYLGLVNYNPSFKKLPILRKVVAWKLSHNHVQNIKIK